MRQNTAVLGITCFIETSSVALRESERKKMGKKEDPEELVEASKKKREREKAALQGGGDATLLSPNCLV